MKKILILSVIMLAPLFAVTSVPAMACSNNGQFVTGSACSIKELNETAGENAEKVRKMDIKEKRDLKPANINKDASKYLNMDCIFKWCFPKGTFKIDY